MCLVLMQPSCAVPQQLDGMTCNVTPDRVNPPPIFAAYARKEWPLLPLLSMPDEFMRDDRGQSLLEYALIIVLVSLVVIVALTLLREQIDQAFRVLIRLATSRL
jgi:Flp pilus assembly pilin Flp